MPRQRRFSSRSSGSRASTIVISPAVRRSSVSVARTMAPSAVVSPRGTRRSLARLSTQIGIGAAATRVLGVGRADVEDRGHHREERLADARQLAERQPALVELALLDALLEDTRDQAANP